MNISLESLMSKSVSKIRSQKNMKIRFSIKYDPVLYLSQTSDNSWHIKWTAVDVKLQMSLS